MQQDAELHAEEDKKRKDLVEAKNQADNLIYATEKSLKEVGDKVDADTKSKVEAEIANVKKAMEGNDADAIKSAVEKLTAASHKLAEMMYSQATKDQSSGGGPEAGGGEAGGAGKEDDVVDADFEEVK